MNHRRGISSGIAGLALALAGCGSPAEPMGDRFMLELLDGADQRAFEGDTLPAQLRIRATDRGHPQTGYAVHIEVRGGGQAEPLELPGADGTQRIRWRLGPDSEQPQELVISLDQAQPIIIQAASVDSALADVVVRAALGAEPLELLFYDKEGFRHYQRMSLGAEEAERDFLPPARPDQVDEAVAFSRGLPPEILTPITWRDQSDTIRLAATEMLRVPVAIWIVSGAFVNQNVWAGQHLAEAGAIWRTAGLAFDLPPGGIIDATGHPAAAAYQQAVAPCGPVAEQIGRIPGRINIYYVGGLTGFNGYSCGGVVMLSANRARGALLAHELGHEFGLGHESPATDNLMAVVAGNGLTQGQIFRAHFHSRSAINQLYGLQPASLVRDCDAAGPLSRGLQVVTRCPPSTFRLTTP